MCLIGTSVSVRDYVLVMPGYMLQHVSVTVMINKLLAYLLTLKVLNCKGNRNVQWTRYGRGYRTGSLINENCDYATKR